MELIQIKNKLQELHALRRGEILTDNGLELIKELDYVLEQLSLHLVMLSFTDDERAQFVEETIICNKQNLNGRETEDEIYEAGVCAGFDDLLEKLNEA